MPDDSKTLERAVTQETDIWSNLKDFESLEGLFSHRDSKILTFDSGQTEKISQPIQIQNDLIDEISHHRFYGFHGFHGNPHLDLIHAPLFTEKPKTNHQLFREHIHSKGPKFTSTPIKASAKRLLSTFVTREMDHRNNGQSEQFELYSNSTPNFKSNLDLNTSPFAAESSSKKFNGNVLNSHTSNNTRRKSSRRLLGVDHNRRSMHQERDEKKNNKMDNILRRPSFPPQQRNEGVVWDYKSEKQLSKKSKWKGKGISQVPFSVHQKQYQQQKLKKERLKSERPQEGFTLDRLLEYGASLHKDSKRLGTIDTDISWKNACDRWGPAWKKFANSL
ncbi:uncharacterized protein SAPINGB_P000693 [Magnusiomyces paraingens]|uniref:Uncharacterized protein n=1 Tax=Magnusiomyces paraingens TaxID=2606893 RepID=A0A5E8B7Q1_9ASCO|nr:uncharacterized protein SAPINGB_P000693 [Saprochaete ingens]VVT45267.1 unnamed protein product [Saprochaete ingens]